LRKKLEDSKAALALFWAQKERALTFSGKRIVALEAKLVEDSLTAWAKINDLEAKLFAANAISEKAIKDHSDIQKELSSMKIKAELDLKALNMRLLHSAKEEGAPYTRAKDLLKSNLDVRAKF
jgi:hypothetical protein